jgi:hypothetical protein
VKTEQPMRNWLTEHPATATYIAAVVTILLLLQLYETIRAL